MKPLCIDLFCGLGGWTEGFLSEGYDVVGFDIERHDYGTGGYPGQLVLQDVLTLHGSQFRSAAVIVASPPCQSYSYRAMPWKRAKELPPPDNTLFEAGFRIAAEAGVPIVIENVKGAQPWVGRAKWHYGSYYLWGDVPALMPFPEGMKNSGGSWFGQRDGISLERNDPRDMRRNENGEWLNGAATGGWNPGKRFDGVKNPGMDWSKYGEPGYKAQGFNVTAAQRFREGSKGFAARFDRSDSRKAASAMIAKIPFELASHIARVFKPR